MEANAFERHRKIYGFWGAMHSRHQSTGMPAWRIGLSFLSNTILHLSKLFIGVLLSVFVLTANALTDYASPLQSALWYACNSGIPASATPAAACNAYNSPLYYGYSSSQVYSLGPFVSPGIYNCTVTSLSGGYSGTSGCVNLTQNAICPAATAYSFNYLTGMCERQLVILPSKNFGICIPCLLTQMILGNPINSGTGNKYQYETDYIGIGVYPLQNERIYNSGGAFPSVVETTMWGSQWRGYYDCSITYFSNGTSIKTVILKRGGGKQLYFNQAIGTATPPLTTTTWTPDADVVGNMVEVGVDASGNPTGWTYTNESDEVETYNAAGKLVSITNRTGLVQTLT